MPSDAVSYFLTHHPRDSVRLLETSRSEDLASFLDGLSVEERAGLLANMLPQTAAAWIGGLDPEGAADVVEKLRSSTAAAILGALTRTARHPIFDALPVEKRENIRHLLRYPDDSVGALMLTNTLACRIDATVRRAKQLVRRFAHTELPLMVVVDDAMKPLGILPLSRLLSEREREPVRDHMRRLPTRLRAHASVGSVLTLPAWNTEDYLPVVEADGRYVGLLPKARLHRHALATHIDAERSTELTETLLALADMVWGPAAELLARGGGQPLENKNDE